MTKYIWTRKKTGKMSGNDNTGEIVKGNFDIDSKQRELLRLGKADEDVMLQLSVEKWGS